MRQNILSFKCGNKNPCLIQSNGSLMNRASIILILCLIIATGAGCLKLNNNVGMFSIKTQSMKLLLNLSDWKIILCSTVSQNSLVNHHIMFKIEKILSYQQWNSFGKSSRLQFRTLDDKCDDVINNYEAMNQVVLFHEICLT